MNRLLSRYSIRYSISPSHYYNPNHYYISKYYKTDYCLRPFNILLLTYNKTVDLF